MQQVRKNFLLVGCVVFMSAFAWTGLGLVSLPNAQAVTFREVPLVVAASDVVDNVAGAGTSDKIEGNVDEAVGTVKRNVGETSGQVEGAAKQAEGKIKQGVGELKEEASETGSEIEDTSENFIDSVKDFFQGN